MGTVKIGNSEDALDRRERILEAKKKRDNEKHVIVHWLNAGKEKPVVYVR